MKSVVICHDEPLKHSYDSTLKIKNPMSYLMIKLLSLLKIHDKMIFTSSWCVIKLRALYGAIITTASFKTLHECKILQLNWGWSYSRCISILHRLHTVFIQLLNSLIQYLLLLSSKMKIVDNAFKIMTMLLTIAWNMISFNINSSSLVAVCRINRLLTNDNSFCMQNYMKKIRRTIFVF